MLSILRRNSIRMANNQPVATRGLLTTTGAADLIHTLAPGRTAIIRKIMWSNNTGAASTLIFGTLTNAAVWVPLFPTITVLNGFDGWYEETHIADVEFVNDRTAGAGGLTGNIHVTGGAAGILVRLTVEEIGA